MSVLAVRLDDVLRYGRRAPHDVLAVGDWLKMRRSNAGLHSAQMVEHEPIGDRTDEPFIDVAMSSEPPAGSIRQES